MMWSGWFILLLVLVLLRKLVMLLARFGWYYGCILVERKVLSKNHVAIGFPRSQEEIWRDPKGFFEFLVANRVIREDPKNEPLQFVHLEALAGIETEPDKNATSASVEVSYQQSGSQQEVGKLRLFLKFQTGKGMPLWLQALRAAAEPGVAREIDFYSKLSPVVPIKTPKALYTGKLPKYNLVCLILEHLDFKARKELRVVPDHDFDSVDDMKLLLTSVAKMHAQFYGNVQTHELTKWIPAKKGLDYCEFVITLGGKKEPKSYTTVFKALQKYFVDKPLTLVHGDCRPGNMIFVNKPATSVIFADWEATNAAPPVWDFTYSTIIGLPAQMRKENLDGLLKAYHDSFAATLGGERSKEGESLSFATFQEYNMLLTIVLFYVSYTVTTGGFWKNQGNTKQDLHAWGVRVLAALEGVEDTKVAEILKIDSKLIEEVKTLARNWEKQMQTQL